MLGVDLVIEDGTAQYLEAYDVSLCMPDLRASYCARYHYVNMACTVNVIITELAI